MSAKSPIHVSLERLVPLGAVAHAALDGILDQMALHEVAALAYDWRSSWARPSQIIDGDFSTYGFLTGRGFGKTCAVVEYAIGEVDAGRARRLALVGQNEAKAVEILVTGETGILELTPPWLGAEWESSTNTVRFGNGAIATVYTAQEPTGLRGPQHDLAIATEIASWPATTRAEAFECLRLGLRLGRGQLLWDSTPKRRNPLIRQLLSWNQANPARHVVVRGSTAENKINLSPRAVEEWTEMWGGTAMGAEELDGVFFDDLEDALFKQSSIDAARRKRPDRFMRRILSIDPAIANAKYADATGIIDLGLGVDQQVYVLSNMSGKHSPGVWPGKVIDAYTRGGCDLVLVETNRGGSTWAELLRNAAKERGLDLIELGPEEVPGNRPGVIYFRPIHARGQKAERARGAAALVERGRVSFVAGELGDLEDRLCGFDGREGKPDDCVDAFVHGVHELALTKETFDPRSSMSGIGDLQRILSALTGPDIVGAMTSHAPARGATINVSGLSVTYDGSRGLRDLFSGSGRGERGL